jgi:hypothetical protein
LAVVLNEICKNKPYVLLNEVKVFAIFLQILDLLIQAKNVAKRLSHLAKKVSFVPFIKIINDQIYNIQSVLIEVFLLNDYHSLEGRG